jgi:VanZ family protein
LNGLGSRVNIFLFVLYAAFIAVVSLRPADGAALGSWDKLLHLLAYSVFALLAYRVASEPRKYSAICLGILVYSGLIEIAQSFMPGRMMSVYDMVANALGIVLGAVVASRVFSTGRNG